MSNARDLPGRRGAFTLIELLVVITLILVIFAIGAGYAMFGQDNQHSVVAVQMVTGAMQNARQRARNDGLPTGIRIVFPFGSTQAGQLQLIQQPDDYTAGQIILNAAASSFTVSFVGVDFQGGAKYLGEIDEATVQAGDYFVLRGLPTAHRIKLVSLDGSGNQSITLDSSIGPVSTGAPYAIVRAPRRLPSEDIISLPPSMVIDNSVMPGNATTLCQNLPQRGLIDVNNPAPGIPVSEIVFAPSGAVIGQGTGADMVVLWMRDPSQPNATTGAPMLASIRIRTGLIGVNPVAPWVNGTMMSIPTNDPYAFVKDPRASGL